MTNYVQTAYTTNTTTKTEIFIVRMNTATITVYLRSMTIVVWILRRGKYD